MNRVSLLALFAALAAVSVYAADVVVTYTAPAEAQTSTDFTVTANGQSLIVYKDVRTQDYTSTRYFVNFSMAGTVTMNVKWTLGFTSVLIKPSTEKITPTLSGKSATFTFTGPRNFSVESNVTGVDNRSIPALYVFASPLEVNIPSPTDPTVAYYAPGHHNIGAYKLPKTKKTMYIAGGAYLNGKIRVDSMDNVLILGRGIINTKYSATRHDDANASIYINRCNGFRMQGITSCGNDTWSMQNIVRYCNQAVIDNHHIVGDGENDDGLNLVGDYCTFNNVFATTHDDNFSTWSGPTLQLKYTGTHATYLNCVARPGCTRAYQVWDGASHFFYKGCKVIGFSPCNDMPSILHDGNGTGDIKNFRYENMSLETQNGWMYLRGSGHSCKNFNVLGTYGNNAGSTSLPFENLVYHGTAVTSAPANWTGSATFKATDASAPTVTITSPARSESVDAVIGTSTTLTFAVTNWPMASGGKGLRYFVNGVNKGTQYTADPIAISGLPIGPNAFSVKLVNDTTYTGVQDAVVVTVTDQPIVAVKTPLPRISASRGATPSTRRIMGIDGRVVSGMTSTSLHPGVYVTDAPGAERRFIATVR